MEKARTKRWQDDPDNYASHNITAELEPNVRLQASSESGLVQQRPKGNSEKTVWPEMIVVSVPPEYSDGLKKKKGTIEALKGNFYYDDLQGRGQTVYILERGWYPNDVSN